MENMMIRNTPMVTTHAVHRYQEHHPDAGSQDVVYAYLDSVEVPSAIIETMLARNPGTSSGTYFLTRDRRGVLVVDNEVFVTYLRLGDAQVDFAKKHWRDDESTVSNSMCVEEEPTHPLLGVPLSSFDVSHDLIRAFGTKSRFRQRMSRSSLVGDSTFIVDGVLVEIHNGAVRRKL